MNRLRSGLALATALLTPIIGHGAGPAKVEVVRVDDGYTLLRDGTPYLVKGAGAVGIDLGSVAARGGNSIRTWGVEEAQTTLDAAHRHGLTVSMGLPVAAERFGFDYDDPQASRSNGRTSAQRCCATRTTRHSWPGSSATNWT